MMSFAAIDPTLERVIESPKESRMGSEWVRWGERNTYPAYLDELAHESPTLRSVILGTVDYICGNAVNMAHGLQGSYMDRRRTTPRKFIKDTAMSILKQGGIAWMVTQRVDLAGVAELEVLPLKYIRTDEDNASFWYNEKWGKSTNAKQYPAWVPGTKEPQSIFFLKLWGDGVYPEPIHAASVKQCEIERAIADFHLGNISRGFMGSYLVNFNNGANVSDAAKKEIERNFTEKFSGHRNAGRVMFSYNPNVQNRTTLEKLEVSDYGEKYATLSKDCRQAIFTAFRCNGNLFGIPTESNGFNSEEYDSAFRLFNRTMVQPIQQQIIDAMEEVLGEKGILTITPFTMEGMQQEVK